MLYEEVGTTKLEVHIPFFQNQGSDWGCKNGTSWPYNVWADGNLNVFRFTLDLTSPFNEKIIEEIFGSWDTLSYTGLITELHFVATHLICLWILIIFKYSGKAFVVFVGLICSFIFLVCLKFGQLLTFSSSTLGGNCVGKVNTLDLMFKMKRNLQRFKLSSLNTRIVFRSSS